VADIKEVLVAWDAGESVSAIARMFGYTRPTVRKYVHAADHAGLVRGGGRRGEAEWERLTRAAAGGADGDGARGAAAPRWRRGRWTTWCGRWRATLAGGPAVAGRVATSATPARDVTEDYNC